jgi:gluconolactonase
MRDIVPATYVSFLEGPAATLGGDVYFADVKGNRIWRWNQASGLDVFREDSGRAIGNAWDLEGRLLTCEGAEHGPGGRRQLTRTDLTTGVVEVLVDRYEGRRLNSPNDVTCDERGRIYFTDPRYGVRTGMELSHESVYRLDPDGTLVRLISQPDIERPNGLAITPDCSELYVVDSNHDVGGARKIWAFSLDADGFVTGSRVVHDFAPGRGGDGMELDADGNLYVCAGIAQPRSAGETTDVRSGVYVMTPGGRLLDFLPIPQDVISNCCFGGPDLRTLYVTAGHLLFSTTVTTPGYHAGMTAAPRTSA